MITVIMPSMFIPEGVVDRIKDIVSSPLVGEFILIDNTDDGFEINEEIPKLVHIKEHKNTFVNPAWNKGAQLSKFNKLMFINDDIITDFHGIIEKVHDEIKLDVGIIGLGNGCWDYTGGEFSIQPIHDLTTGFGCLFFIHKNAYKLIPNELKVWYGDNWLLSKIKRQGYKIVNWKVGGKVSETVSKREFNSVIQNDVRLWENKYFKLKP